MLNETESLDVKDQPCSLRERIKELEATKAELQQSEEYLKQLTASMPAGLIVVDGETHIILNANKMAVTLFGAPEHEIIGKICHKFICPRELGNCPITDCGQTVDKAERVLLTADGGSIPIIKTVHPLRLPGKTLLLETFIDISDRKIAEQSLRKERDRVQQYLDVAGTIIMALDEKGAVILINRAGCAVLGCEEHEIVGRNWLENFLPPRIRHSVNSLFMQLMAGNVKPYECNENPVITASGEERIIAWHNTLLRDEHDKAVGTLSSGEDITERVLAEQALDALVESTVGTIGQDCFDKIVSGLCGWLGADCALIGRIENGEVHSLAMQLDGSMVPGYTYKLQGSPCESTIEQKYCSGPGTAKVLFPTSSSQSYCIHPEKVREKFPGNEHLAKLAAEAYAGTIIHDKNGRTIGLLHIVCRKKSNWPQNLTKILELMAAKVASELDRAQTEESLSQFKNTLDSTLDCVFMFDPESLRFFYVNQGAMDQLGYSREELLGMTPMDIKPHFDEPAFRALIEPLMRGEYSSTTFQTYHRSKSGNDIPVEIFLQFIPGNKKHFVAIVRDITERKNIETKLRQAYKMEAMGTLAGGIAHEFNNILTAILGFADLAKEEMPEGSLARGDINEVLKASNRAKNLVNQILSFSRQAEQQKMQPIQIQPVIKEALKLLRSSTPSTIEIVQNITTEDTTVKADPTQIHQLFMNLCTNALHAIENEKGVIEVTLKRTHLQAQNTAPQVNLPPGEYIELCVRDTGKGMEESIISRIFDPFFTTKDVDKGTGMGLSVVHGIVESHQGAVSVESRVGNGSTFHVFFPVAEDEAPETPLDHEPVPTGSEQILFVDDEMVIAHMGKQMLERLGYKVTARTSSVEAFEAFRAQPDKFDLIITDQTMPNLTGEELAEKILAIRPHMPIILSTGYSSMVDEAKAKATGIREFIPKPVDRAKLAKTIRKVLEQK